jgi:pimeloyl-ACP methyl ester carboxylesterase
METVREISLPDHRLRYQQSLAPQRDINSPGVMFLSGFGSDMSGTKASFFDQWSRGAGVDFLRFDYRGCGLSDGKFEDYTIGDWLADSLAMLDEVARGPQILVGSSMGGWIMLLLARLRPERIKGMVGLAAAPDFTERLVWNKMTQAQKKEMADQGAIFEQGLPITRKLIEEGRRHLILDRELSLPAPLHLVQGQRDEEVPWNYPFQIAQAVTGDRVRITLLREADHRLSRTEDLALLGQILQQAVDEGAVTRA